jgi:hypothetical protein
MIYACEPVPAECDAVTAAYLDRQFNAIGLAMTPEGRLILPTASVLPRRLLPGAILYIVGDGVYACISDTAEGTAKWTKLIPVNANPELNLSGKTWDDFL